MTDVSDLREGDEIEVVVRARISKPTSWAKGRQTAHLSDGSYFYVDTLKRISKSFTVVRPEIIPGQPYVDAAGRLFIGLAHGRVTRVDGAGDVDWYGGEGSFREGNPLPAGLRPAKVVPES